VVQPPDIGLELGAWTAVESISTCIKLCKLQQTFGIWSIMWQF